MMKYNIIHQNFLQNIDILGIGINIRFNQKPVHKTKIGGLITLIILFLMAYQIKLVVDNLTDSKNPTVLFEQRYAQSPERYNLEPKNFSFMFGLQDPNSMHYMDPSVYKVTLWSKKTQKVLDPTTGDYFTQWNNRIIKTEPCTKEHFQVEGAQDYFLKLKFSTMYCISKQEKDIYLEGQFDGMTYSSLQIIIETCTGNSCKSPDQIQAQLNNGRLAVYYIDHAIVPSDRDNPFIPLGRQSFWVSGPQFTKSLIISVRNSYLLTDVGFINQDIKEQRTLTWSFDREQTIPKVENILYDCYFSFEKNINSVYKRSYVKFDRAISQIGGAFNVLFAVGCLLCRPLSQLELNRKLINSLFNFEEDEDENYTDKKKKEKELSKSKDKSILQDLIHFNDVIELKNPQNSTCVSSRPSQTQMKDSFTSQLNPFKKILFTQSVSHDERRRQNPRSNSKLTNQIQNSSSSNQQQKSLQNLFRQQTNKMKFKGYEYFVNLFKFSDVCRNRKEKLFHKGVNKLYNHIDIFYLINKLLEVEKLKHLLLNEDQIKLFEFIPKPTICMSERKPQSNSDNVEISYESNKTIIEKTADAQDSLKKIIKKGETVSKIDQRLIEFLDPKFKLCAFGLDNKSTNPNQSTSKLVNALEAKNKIHIQLIETDDQILQIPLEYSSNESSNQSDSLNKTVEETMINYKSRKINKIKL